MKLNGKRGLGLCLTLVLALSACASGGGDSGSAEYPDPGVTDGEIVFFGTYPFSGAASGFGSVGRGAEAYFKYVNDELGGVKMADGKTREIRFLTGDDGYETSRALTQTQRFVEQDEAFANFHTLGTPINLAIRDYLNEMEVPQLFTNSADSRFGAEHEKYPWTIGWNLSFASEAAIVANSIDEWRPDATVGALVANVEGSLDYFDAFKRATEGTGIKVVEMQTVEVADTSVDSQMAVLARAKPDVFLNVTTTSQATRSFARANELGWAPDRRYVMAAGSSIGGVMEPLGLDVAEGIYTVNFLKDPSDERWTGDKDLATYFDVIKKYGAADISAQDSLTLQGYAAAATLVETLKKAEPTRKSVMQSARSLEDAQIPALLPDVVVATGSDDPFPIESGYLVQLQKGQYVPGDLITNEGGTGTD
jgi:branched-chain amino acid transport system substrate-binding protein